MGIPSLSPAVTVNEIDLTLTARAIPQTTGAFAGHFQWGPVEKRVLIDSEASLANFFFYPNDATYVGWLTASSFLAYASGLWVSRANSSSHLNATTSGTGLPIRNEDFYIANYFDTGVTAGGNWVARYMGDLGNSLRVSLCPVGTGNAAFQSDMTTNVDIRTANSIIAAAANTQTDTTSPLQIGDEIYVTSNTNQGGFGWAEVLGFSGNNIIISNSSTLPAFSNTAAKLTRRWKYAKYFDSAPGTSTYVTRQNGANDEIHIAVVDRDGKFTGTANTVLETFPFVSVASDAVNSDGTSNYYKQVLFNKSRYVYWGNHLSAGTNWGNTANGRAFTAVQSVVYNNLSGGNIGTPSDANLITALDQFKNPEEVDVSFIMMGNASNTVAQYAIQSIAEIRYDCIVTFSPTSSHVVETPGNELNNITSYVANMYRSAFGVMDSGWKYMFDRYSNKYRYVPLNGDIAGLMARTNNPWDSPAGPTKGRIRNAIKLAWNPTKAERDELYRRGVNPVNTFPGEGIQLFGDKTFLTKPTAFDHINVRRLFSYVEKVIARAARNSLFELNDEFTRARFVGLVEPFLREVQGQRGIYDFRVVCDETNNTPQVIDSNQFVGDIYIKPARSINDIQLNFIATPTGVSFDEIIGRFG